MNPLDKYKEIPPFVSRTDYKPKTTLWGDFGVADVFYLNGTEPKGVQDTFNRAFKQYMDDREGGTELAIVLNWKMWEHYEEGQKEGREKHKKLARLYDRLWAEMDAYACEYWKGDDLSYYLKTTD